MIEMLNVSANWSKVKAGFKGGKLFKSIAAKPKLSFAEGFEADAIKSVQGEGKIPNAFTGKTFNAKRR